MPDYKEKLEKCSDMKEVDVILNELQVGKTAQERLEYLNKFMGVLAEYDEGDFSPEENYDIAKEYLINGNWRYYK